MNFEVVQRELLLSSNCPEIFFRNPIAQTRKTIILTSPEFPDLVLKKPLGSLQFSSSDFIAAEIQKETIARSYLEPNPWLDIPQEHYFVADNPLGDPTPYRLQALQPGKLFSEMPRSFFPSISEQLIYLIEADERCFSDHGYHLDLIGFTCDHRPTTEEVVMIYQDPFPHATNLIAKTDGKIAWVDAKTSNLSTEQNQIRAELFSRLKHKLNQRIMEDYL